ncbi:MAG: hypothetical protein OJF48_001915 [Afipia sp.]|jgi:hypothetical protein|nr:MAG: hypothetical protein OJF48_001915 [Afipia sp.]
MIRYIVTGALLGVLALAAVIASSVIAPTEAGGLHPDCNFTMPCTPVVSAKPSSPREARRIARATDSEMSS